MAEEAKTEEQTPDVPDGYVKNRLDGGYLPPIHRIKMPKTTTQTAKVRWLFALGYEVKEISKGLGIRYQQARNMVTTQPKRAAREDLPELRIELADVEDIVDTLLGIELERTHAEARKQSRRKKGPEPEEQIPEDLWGTKGDGILTITEDVEGNEALDDENYGRE